MKVELILGIALAIGLVVCLGLFILSVATW